VAQIKTVEQCGRRVLTVRETR